MKYIIFIKDHPSGGMPEGSVSKLKEQIADKFIEQGFAEKSTEKEYEAYKEEFHANKEKSLKAKRAAGIKLHKVKGKAKAKGNEQTSESAPVATTDEEGSSDNNPELSDEDQEKHDEIIQLTGSSDEAVAGLIAAEELVKEGKEALVKDDKNEAFKTALAEAEELETKAKEFVVTTNDALEAAQEGVTDALMATINETLLNA